MFDRLIRAVLVVGGVSLACAWTRPGMFPEADPVAVLVRIHTPLFYRAVVAWYYVAPGVAVFLAGQFLISTSRIWFARMGVSLGLRPRLPRWPLSPTADGPAIVVGEVHHPTRAEESTAPEWLTIPERGLFTGVAIFGAVGSGKTSACLHPFARQLLSWQAGNPDRRVAALILEVKGDFCHDIRAMLAELGRGDDYIELSLDGRITWNPLSATWLDSYSLAYTVASLLNQLFGKGKEPFWQQAYTNLVRWIIELYRVLPGPDGGVGWVTLRDVYHCAIDKTLFNEKIKEAKKFAESRSTPWVTIGLTESLAYPDALLQFDCKADPSHIDRLRTPATEDAIAFLTQHKIPHQRHRTEDAKTTDLRLRVEAVTRWYNHDWNTLDTKIRTSIVEGVSVFLSMFDLPDVARVFCPPAPAYIRRERGTRPAPKKPTADDELTEPPASDRPTLGGTLPPLDTLIERGKVLALNMPAGTNPALARAIGVMLKNAWLQSLLRRPAKMKDERRPLRPPRRLYLRRVSSLCQCRRGRSERRRESLCAHPAVPGDPHRRHPIHQLPAVRARERRGVAHALTDAPHPHLFIPQRRGQRGDGLEALRAGGENQKQLHHQRIEPAGRHQFPVRPGRRRQGQRRREQELSRAPRGALSAARLRAPR